MEGSSPDVIKDANYITTTNQEEGVAKVLEKFS